MKNLKDPIGRLLQELQGDISQEGRQQSATNPDLPGGAVGWTIQNTDQSVSD